MSTERGNMEPDAVFSGSGNATTFDAEDYLRLRDRYLLPRVRENAELAGGMRLRRQTAASIIDGPGYAKLRATIRTLETEGDQGRIYRLLSALRDWEIRGSGAMPRGEGGVPVGPGEVVEMIDLTKEEQEVIDIDTYIADVLLRVGSDDAPNNRLSILPDHVGSRTDTEGMSKDSQGAARRSTTLSDGFHPQRELEVVDLLEFPEDRTEKNRKIRAWEREEDTKLCSLAAAYGPGVIDWARVTNELNTGRSGLQCLQRYERLRNAAPMRTRARLVSTYSQSVKQESHAFSNIDECSSSTSRVGMTSFSETTASSSCLSNVAEEDIYCDSIKIHVHGAVPEEQNTKPSPTTAMQREDQQDDLNRISKRNEVAEAEVSEPGHSISATPRLGNMKDNTAEAPDGTTVSVSVSVPVTAKEEAQSIEDDAELRAAWHKQSRLRHEGKWKPSGGWKAPQWATQPHCSVSTAKDENITSSCAEKESNPKKKRKTTKASCSRAVLADAVTILAGAVRDKKGVIFPDTVKSLTELKWNGYKKVTDDLLIQAHSALHRFLPDGDCDSYEVVKIARAYYDYWRPRKGNIRAILLAESHSFTETKRALSTGLSPQLLPHYLGPRNFIQLVYCLAYGENDALHNADVAGGPNAGTSQFWTLFAACSRGTDYIPSQVAQNLLATSKNPFALDVLKRGGLNVEDRLSAKLAILNDLKARGIWLLDVSIIGWYISQPQKFRRSKKTQEIHRMAKARPPKDMKAPSLILSWELYSKHLLREVAEEGALRLLVPIGKELSTMLSRERVEEAVTVAGAPACAIESIPAPNAWIPGGYGPFYRHLSDLMDQHAPPDRSSV